MPILNATHDPKLKSFVTAANAPDCDFPIQNLPFGCFSTGSSQVGRIGVAIGDQILDLTVARAKGLFDGLAGEAAALCLEPTLNALMAAGPAHWSALRARLSKLLAHDSPDESKAREAFVPMRQVEMRVPVAIGDYSDFLCSYNHAINVGRLFRPDNPLASNFYYVPIGYHGRSSSIVVSGTPCVRPHGQSKSPDAAAPTFGPSRRLDYELEMGFFVGPGSGLAQGMSLDEAENNVFGVCILNDWSARDIQAWESTPLGPFLGKSFNSAISPWVVTLEALAPFRTRAFRRPDGEPQPLPYLFSEDDQKWGGIDIRFEVAIRTDTMRAAGEPAHVLGRSNFRDMYWTIFQMLTHHASNGCNLRPGDMLGSGTISGPTSDSHGCMLELTKGGREPAKLPNGETRAFVEDGDEIVMRAECTGGGYVRIGFGECRAVVQPARP